MEPVTVHYKLSESELVATHRWLLFRNLPMRLAMILTTLACLLPVVLLPVRPALGLGLLSLWWPFFVILGLVYYFAYCLIPRRYYRGDRKFRDGITYVFTEDHVVSRGKYVETKSDWRYFTSVHEGEKLYLLLHGRDLTTVSVIPKRAFRSKRDESAFRSIVFARLGKKLEGRRDEAAAPPADDYSPAALQPPDWR